MVALAAALLLWWAARGHRFDWRVFLASLAALRWQWLVAAAGFGMATYVGRALRWAVLLRPVKPHPGLWNLTCATAMGFTAITLLGRPGELVRPYLIAVKERVPVSSQMAAWMLERIYDLLMALVLFGFALSRVRHSGVTAGPAMRWAMATGGWVAAGIGAVSLLVLLLIRHFSEPMRRRILDALAVLPQRYLVRITPLVNAFVQGVESTRSSRAVVLLTGYTVLEWMLIAASTFCLLRSFGGLLHFGLVDVLIFMGFVSFGAVVQIPGIGGGFQLVAILVLNELFAVPVEVAASVAMLLWVIGFVVVVPFGLVLGFREGLNWNKLKELGREVAP